tara:strand:+ start:413 stop:2899 length:2487 start_codon:yes stop_codon:yes gene_type:complete
MSEVNIAITKRGSGYKTTDTNLNVKGNVIGGSDVTFDVDELHISENCAQTGDDYLILSDDATDNPSGYLYSKSEDTWGDRFLSIGQSNNYKPAFYSVDGSVRISDSNFGGSNDNQWYGYVDRTLFGNSGKSYNINRWINEQQNLKKPVDSEYTTTVTSTALTISQTKTYNISGDTTKSQFYNNDDLNNTLTSNNVVNSVIKVKYKTPAQPTGSSSGDNQAPHVVFKGTLRVGAGTSNNFNGTNHTIDIHEEVQGWDQEIIKEYTFTFPSSGDDEIDISTNTNSQGMLVKLENTSKNGNKASGAHFGLNQAKFQSGSWAGSTHAAAKDMNVICEIEEKSNTSADLWDNNGWNFGVSFVYDEIQESAVQVMRNTTDNNTYSNFASDKSPSIKILWKYSDEWNKRVTGINFYTRKSGKKVTDKSWYRQIEVDFAKGKAKMTHGGNEFDIKYIAQIDEYYVLIDEDNTSSPNLIDSFEVHNGYSDKVEFTSAKFKTGVVANRKAYIANLQVWRSDGTKENMADAMLKSPPNQFDVFPSTNLIECSVRDGDVIVKLEEYADRILQFKKDKLHIINISQNVEFMEGTYDFKGIKHPAASCKTDMGIAWVNENGCFLYDGRSVSNLLERGALRVIKESEWQSFITDDSIIGYLPKKRQIIVLKTCLNNAVGDVYVYDIITKSWVLGDSKFPDSTVKSNFINDWNGDLVIAHGTTGTISKWSDSSFASTVFKYITPDMDFGQPAQRKRIYKIYVTYKSGGSNVPSLTYGINGSTSVSTAVVDGSFETGKSDWTRGEFKLDKDANDCYSIRLKIAGSIDSAFEINDISIVYRGKPVK